MHPIPYSHYHIVVQCITAIMPYRYWHSLLQLILFHLARANALQNELLQILTQFSKPVLLVTASQLSMVTVVHC